MPRTATPRRVTSAPAGSAASGGRASNAAATSAASGRAVPVKGVPVGAGSGTAGKAGKATKASKDSKASKALPVRAAGGRPANVAAALVAAPAKEVSARTTTDAKDAAANGAAKAARSRRGSAPATTAGTGTSAVPAADQVFLLAVAEPAPAPDPGREQPILRKVVAAPRSSRRRGRFQRAVVPVALGSLTQPGARSGDTCVVCGSVRVTGLALLLTDGTPVRFTSCHTCEHRTWVGPDGELDREAVLERTRKLR